MSTVYISFCAEISFKTVQNLLGATLDQMNKGATTIHYLFSTPGGTVQPGIALYNILKGLPVQTVMQNVGAVDSIGNAVFLAGKRRIACPHSTFMFHGVGLDVSGITRLEEKSLRERLDGVTADQGKMGGIIAQETALQRAEIDSFFLEAKTKDAAFALERGIVHEIAAVAVPSGARLLQLVF
jgi:ATP-dependent Clp protease, protease subunit